MVRALAYKGVLGGVSLGRLYPGAAALEKGLVVAVTETCSRQDIEALATALRSTCDPTRLLVDALPATELSGFGLRSNMADTLVVAISQSGTTTDTNRTVDLVRSRGARVVAIVNRRGTTERAIPGRLLSVTRRAKSGFSPIPLP